MYPLRIKFEHILFVLRFDICIVCESSKAVTTLRLHHRTVPCQNLLYRENPFKVPI